MLNLFYNISKRKKKIILDLISTKAKVLALLPQIYWILTKTYICDFFIPLVALIEFFVLYIKLCKK